ncbi:MAG: laccase domain-containing protein [Acidobacteriota bacterium]
MRGDREADGVIAVELGHAFAVFAGASASPSGASPAELAEETRRRVSAWIGRDVPALYATQVHSRLAYVFSPERQLDARAHHVGECDALLTGEPGVVLTVRTADCLPVAIAGGGVVGIVHAGWRGLAADILGATVRRLEVEFGVSPSALAAAIGVGVGPCHYRVGGEVVAALGKVDVGGQQWRSEDRVDLGGWAECRLAVLGLGRVHRLAGCTACAPGYHSYRRDGQRAGRQWSAVVTIDA